MITDPVATALLDLLLAFRSGSDEHAELAGRGLFNSGNDSCYNPRSFSGGGSHEGGSHEGGSHEGGSHEGGSHKGSGVAGGGRGGRGGGSPSGELISAASGKCLDTFGSYQSAGTKEEIWGCHQGPGQTWTQTSAQELRVFGSDCLTVFRKRATAGTTVMLWPCNGGQNQKWAVSWEGQIVGITSGLCLNITGNGLSNGDALDIATCNDLSNQQWSWSSS